MTKSDSILALAPHSLPTHALTKLKSWCTIHWWKSHAKAIFIICVHCHNTKGRHQLPLGCLLEALYSNSALTTLKTQKITIKKKLNSLRVRTLFFFHFLGHDMASFFDQKWEWFNKQMVVLSVFCSLFNNCRLESHFKVFHLY